MSPDTITGADIDTDTQAQTHTQKQT